MRHAELGLVTRVGFLNSRDTLVVFWSACVDGDADLLDPACLWIVNSGLSVVLSVVILCVGLKVDERWMLVLQIEAWPGMVTVLQLPSIEALVVWTLLD